MSRWRLIEGEEASALEDALQRDLPVGHELKGLATRAHARRADRDDVAFVLADGRICVVHLTWNAKTEPGWPRYEIVERLED